MIERHPGERVLVHCVSYKLTEFLFGELVGEMDGREMIRYRGADGRARAERQLRESDGGVLFAPSFERGVDLVGDACRVVIVAKIPFPNLGDQQVSARLHRQGGQTWYSCATVRSLVQMTGRAVRGEDDWAVCYLLDAQFVKQVLRKNRWLLPEWWREALVTDFPVKELV